MTDSITVLAELTTLVQIRDEAAASTVAGSYRSKYAVGDADTLIVDKLIELATELDVLDELKETLAD